MSVNELPVFPVRSLGNPPVLVGALAVAVAADRRTPVLDLQNLPRPPEQANSHNVPRLG